MVLLKEFRIGTLFKLLGSIISDGCNNSIFLDIGVEVKNPRVSGEKTMLWHQRLGHIREKGIRVLHIKGMVESMANCPQILIYVNIAYMGSRIV
jgi:hypothetical protein